MFHVQIAVSATVSVCEGATGRKERCTANPAVNSNG